MAAVSLFVDRETAMLSTAQSLHLSHCTGMPGPQTLHSKWQEGDALAVAGLPGLELALVGIIVGMAWSGGCSSDF